MRIKFIGAAGGSVTGSCTHFHYPRTNTTFLVDCGLVQGEGDFESINSAPFPFDASEVQFVLLTHAHLDHCGLLPKLYRAGFNGSVICTAATAKLAQMSLLDSAGYPGSLFSKDEVRRIRFKPIEDNPSMAQASMFPVSKDLFASFRRTAHIVGSCSVTIGWLDEYDQRRYVLMSGDLGNNTRENLYQPLLGHRRSIFGYPDAIVVESTYGDRSRSAEHKSFDGRMEAWRSLLQEQLFDRKSLLLVPAFALQRTQEVLVDLFVVLRRFFAHEAQATAPSFSTSLFAKHFVDGAWTSFANNALMLAIESLPSEEQRSWLDAFEISDDEVRPHHLKSGHTKTLEDVRVLMLSTRQLYPVDVYLDSKLARGMGAIIRQEILRRGDHNHDQLANGNPDLAGRLGVKTDQELTDLLNQLMPDADAPSSPVQIGPHTIQYVDSFATPSRSKCEQRGAILITGGGMCDGGPVVTHLEKLTTAKRECVLVQTGFMSKHSLGGRLTQVIRAVDQGDGASNSSVTLGSLGAVPVKDIQLRAVDLSPYYSGHADQDGLVDFVCTSDGRTTDPSTVRAARVFINHGHPTARQGLKAAIEAKVSSCQEGCRAIDTIELPESDLQTYDLALGQWVVENETPSIENLLASMLREQSKTNELLRQLVNVNTQLLRSQFAGRPPHAAKTPKR